MTRADILLKAPAIAIDGPSASGKTTVGLRLAERLGYTFIDTGAMYRAVTLLALERGLRLDDIDALTRLAQSIAIRFSEQKGSRPPDVFVDGRNVTASIYTTAVDAAVSAVSKVPGVRHALVKQQRDLAAKGRVVMVGRDIGTQVLPDARLKIFLEASAEVRARRRFLEMDKRGGAQTFEFVLADLRRRDDIDSKREMSPLVAAHDARRVDTNDRNVEQVVDSISEMLERL
ncbi:MAG: (d)CMP kinase [Chloroflexi bacterium]|nr:(d)CMP kinase [Chloroflexota bacterium]